MQLAMEGLMLLLWLGLDLRLGSRLLHEVLIAMAC